MTIHNYVLAAVLAVVLLAAAINAVDRQQARIAAARQSEPAAQSKYDNDRLEAIAKARALNIDPRWVEDER